MLRLTLQVPLIALVTVACGPAAELPRSGVADDAGRVVRLSAPAARIVSLSPGTTELLFDLGVGDRLVGRTRWDHDPPAARAVPNVGDGFEPNVEAVVAQRPDLVVIYQSPSNANAIARFEQLGIATVSLRTDLLADFARATRILGQLAGRTARADSLLARFDSALAAVRAPQRHDAPRGAIIAWDNPPIVIGSESFLHEILTLSGAVNVFADIASPSATVSVETIAARDPDFLLVPGEGPAPQFVRRPEWQAVRAVREGRYLTVQGTEFGHPSFRAPSAVRQLRAMLETPTP